jgi:hypothetical protein
MRDATACLSFALLVSACTSDDAAPIGDGTDTDTTASTDTTDTTDTTVPSTTEASTTATTDSSSTTMTTEVDSTTMGDESETDTDEDGPCRSDDECTDAIEAFCVEGACVSCSDTDSPDETCADADATAPLCVAGSCISCADAADPDDVCSAADPDLPACLDGQCVQCSESNDTLCSGDTPACVAGECAPCSFHFECPDSACHLWTGACLDATPATVGPDPAHDYATLGAALQSVAAGEEAVFILHDNTNDAPYVESLLIENERVVAVLAADGHRPLLQGVEADLVHGVRVLTEATFIAEGLRFSGFHPVGGGVRRPLHVVGSRLALDRTEVTDNRGAIFVIQDNANDQHPSDAIIRNTTVGVTTTSAPAILVTASHLRMSYSTLAATGTGAGVGNNRPAGVICSATTTLDIRNSIIVNVHDETDSLHNCDNEDVTVTYTATREAFPGAGNVVVGSLVQNWFASWPGNLRLSAQGDGVFEDIAQWITGDPPTDLDDTLRPSVDGTADHAGAHKP